MLMKVLIDFTWLTKSPGERWGAISKPLFYHLKTAPMRQVKLIISRSPSHVPTIAESHASLPLTTSDIHSSAQPFSPTQRRNQGYFFHCAFMSKGATECVIWSAELSVGRQLALDSMKDLAIHSSFSLLDRNIIRGIIVECGCRRGAKRSHRTIVVERRLLSAGFAASVDITVPA